MAVGASLWGAYNQVGEFGQIVTKPGKIGCQYGYVNLTWQPGSEIFKRARATGLQVKDYQDLILVNQAGLRFYDETKGQYTSNKYGDLKPYTHASYLNAAHENLIPPTTSTRRWPAPERLATAAVPSGPSLTPTRPSARAGW